MNRMWSVRTIPCLVFTVVPSTIGRMSRCTPSRLTSGPGAPCGPAILSTSSWKMMAFFSTRSRATFPARILVHLVQEDDAVLLHAFQGHAGHLFHVDQLPFFFLHQVFNRF